MDSSFQYSSQSHTLSGAPSPEPTRRPKTCTRKNELRCLAPQWPQSPRKITILPRGMVRLSPLSATHSSKAAPAAQMTENGLSSGSNFAQVAASQSWWNGPCLPAIRVVLIPYIPLVVAINSKLSPRSPSFSMLSVINPPKCLASAALFT